MSRIDTKLFKEDLTMLKHDMKVLKDIVKYADENIDNVKPETVGKFQRHIDELVDKLKVVSL